MAHGRALITNGPWIKGAALLQGKVDVVIQIVDTPASLWDVSEEPFQF